MYLDGVAYKNLFWLKCGSKHLSSCKGKHHPAMPQGSGKPVGFVGFQEKWETGRWDGLRRRLAKAHNNVAASSVVALKLLGFHSAALPARRLNPNFVLYCIRTLDYFDSWFWAWPTVAGCTMASQVALYKSQSLPVSCSCPGSFCKGLAHRRDCIESLSAGTYPWKSEIRKLGTVANNETHPNPRV